MDLELEAGLEIGMQFRFEFGSHGLAEDGASRFGLSLSASCAIGPSGQCAESGALDTMSLSPLLTSIFSAENGRETSQKASVLYHKCSSQPPFHRINAEGFDSSLLSDHLSIQYRVV